MRPKVLFHQPNDYWHKPAELPTAAWTAAVELIAMDDASKAARSLGQTRPRGLHRTRRLRAHARTRRAINPPELLARLHFDRAVKTPYELACMRHASELGARGHRGGPGRFPPRRLRIRSAHEPIWQACRQREEEMPYNNIVAYNENAAVLHYQHLERTAPGRRCAHS